MAQILRAVVLRTVASQGVDCRDCSQGVAYLYKNSRYNRNGIRIKTFRYEICYQRNKFCHCKRLFQRIFHSLSVRCLADEIGFYRLFAYRHVYSRVASRLYALYKPSHVVCQSSHGLKSLKVFFYVFAFAERTVNLVPIL